MKRLLLILVLILLPAAALAATTDIKSGAAATHRVPLYDPYAGLPNDPNAYGSYPLGDLFNLLTPALVGAEPAAGNPGSDGQCWKSSTLGVRYWGDCGTGGGGVSDHGGLTGLADDDHLQYFNQARGDGRYSLLGHTHSSATTGAAGFMSATDKSKLDGIAAGATVNATDAQLRDRATHTGSQAIGTVTGLQTALDAKASATDLANHAGATGNVHGLTVTQAFAILRGTFPEMTLVVKTPTQPSLDANLTARLATIGLAPGDVVWVEGAVPGSAPGDTTPPTVTTFDLPATSTSLTVPVSTFTATDNTGVTGYLVTESASTPSSGAAGWSGSAPANYVSTAVGSRTAYAWAKDAAGNVSSSLSDSVVITTAPNAPTGVSGTPGDTTLTANWTVSAADSTHSAATSQRVYRDTDSNPFDSANYQDFANNTTNSHQFTGLTNGQAYYIGVRATNSAGSTNSTVAGPYTPTASGDSTKPTVGTFTVGSATGLTVPITAYTASDNVGVTGYLVTESSTPPSAASVNLTPAPTSYTTGSAGIKSLYPWVRDAAGNVNNAFGSPRSVTFLAAPTGVSATPGDTTVSVSWSAVTNATSYDLKWGTSAGSLTNTITGVTSPYSHTGRTNGTTYYYGVLAKATNSTSAQSAEVSATPSAADTTPDAFNFTDQTGVAVSSWITSNSQTITGINAPATVSSLTGGLEYRVNGGSWINTTGGTVSSGQSVEVRLMSSSSNETQVSGSITIGGVSDSFAVTTEAGQASNAFSEPFNSGLGQFTGIAGTPINSSGRLLLDSAGETVRVETAMNRGFAVEYDLQLDVPDEYSAHGVKLVVGTGSTTDAGNRYAISINNGDEDGPYGSAEIFKNDVSVASTVESDYSVAAQRIRIEFHPNSGATPNAITIKQDGITILTVTDGTYQAFSYLFFASGTSKNDFVDNVLVEDLP